MNYVMIVDDSEPDQFLSKFMVQQNNPSARILQAYDGKEALEMLNAENEHPEVIFLDINMPRMNGHEFLEEYNKNRECSSVVVMLSPSDQGDDKEKTLKYQCVKKYLIKPICPNSIAEIDNLINQKS